MSDNESAILDFVDECVTLVRVTDDTFQAVKQFYNNTQLAELTLLIGHYMMTALFLDKLEIPLDKSTTSWDGMFV
ncbi:hypothetical protein C2125_13630 [Rahnella aquatilis]|nr:hypothetical protein C2125_13630 [Rahnella aquatilis]